jgi:hypothetical protein
LIIYGFTSHSRIFHSYGDVTIASEELQNFGLSLGLRAFEERRIFIAPRELCFSGLIRWTSQFIRLLRQATGWGEPILTQILMGLGRGGRKVGEGEGGRLGEEGREICRERKGAGEMETVRKGDGVREEGGK